MKKTVIPLKQKGMAVFFILSDLEGIVCYIQDGDTWHLWRAVHRELRSHRQSPGVFQSFHVKADCLSVG